jgi:signal transduction histidine kinase
MDFFADDDEVERLEQLLGQAGDAAGIALRLPLAWQLRQRDSQRALQLAHEVEQALPAAPALTEAERTRALARVRLIAAEVHWLHGDVDQAQGPLDAAQAMFAALADPIGQGDACWLAGFVQQLRAEPAQSEASVLAAQRFYAAGQDALRLAAAQARSAFYAAFRDPAAARAQWHSLMDSAPPEHPAAQSWAFAAKGVIDNLSGDLGPAAQTFLRGYEAALRCGNLNLAANCAINVSASFEALNDLAAALDWGERGLALARRIANPGRIASAGASIGETLRRLQRHAEAHARLHEALAALAHMPTHPTYLSVLVGLAELALDTGEHSDALAWAEQAEARALAAQQREMQTKALRQQAQALGHLGRAQEALAKATVSLAMARETANAAWQMEALRVLAGLYRQHALPAPKDLAGPSAALHYMHQAVAVARAIPGYRLPDGLLADYARDLAEAGDPTAAYALEHEARLALLRTHSKEASDRAIAMQVRFEMDRLQAEAAHHRELAAAESRRAQALGSANATLEELGAIGREITASLSARAVIVALDQHVNQLLDAGSFSIYLLDAGGQTLSSTHRVEAGKSLGGRQVALDHPSSNLARCVRERVEIVVQDEPGQLSPSHIPGTLVTLSSMYAPLAVGDQVLGAMTIQSPRAHAYGERERAIFRTLCAYGAIALANAQALQELKAAQVRLAQQEKLASLGALVAGISHELNTPIGNALMTSTSLQHEFEQMVKRMSVGQVTRSGLKGFLTQGNEASALVVQSIQRAAALLDSFKQVSVDQTAQERRVFDLRMVVEDSCAALRPALERQSIALAVQVAPGIACDSFPESVGWVVRNLVHNCSVHAFERRPGGTVTLGCTQQDGMVRLSVADDGVGMSPHTLAHVFDPFFTTKLGHGRSGFGLAVCYRIASTVLGGDLSATSAPGQGSTFNLRFPLRAPFLI